MKTVLIQVSAKVRLFCKISELLFCKISELLFCKISELDIDQRYIHTMLVFYYPSRQLWNRLNKKGERIRQLGFK